jgi:putative ubiquitin-RnfH superfamily antitoxin RatB of RatAB toxin-antitoxin module
MARPGWDVADTVNVEVVLATPEKQVLLALDVDVGTSVADVIARSGIAARFPGIETAEMPVGIWGKPVSRDSVVSAGDRVELYRPLEVDPREARRQRALNEKR